MKQRAPNNGGARAQAAGLSDGSCVARVYGCMTAGALNYVADATDSDHSCVPRRPGCMSAAALNQPLAEAL